MSQNTLAKKISEKVGGSKRTMISRKSGVPETTLSQIMTGAIKNPGIYTIEKLADIFNCSIDELLERGAFINAEVELRPALFKSCVLTVLDLIHQKNPNLNIDKLWHIIRGIYSYCLSKNLETVDTKFANGFIEGFER